jgi:predicted DNA-binding protein
MTITVTLPPATIEKLQAEADATGKDISTLVTEAVEKNMALAKVSLKDALKPMQDAIAASGMAAEDADAILEQELADDRAEQRASRGKP